MAQISIDVSKQHGSTITVSQMITDECLGFETKVFLRAYAEAEPHVYCNDSVYIHGEPDAIRSLLEQCLAALDTRLARKEAA